MVEWITQDELPPPAGASAAGRGRGRLAVVIACGAVTGLLLLAQLRVGLDSAGRRVGMFVRETPSGLVVRELHPGAAAERAGLRSGDVVLQVAGVPVTNTADYDRVAIKFESSTPVDFLVNSAGLIRRVTVRPGVPFRWGDYLLGALTALAF